ncbi:MAG: DUF494 family protein [Ignavibacteria bacterium]
MIQEKIIEIIVLLMSELKNNRQIGEIDLQKLSNLGYTQKEINTAFSWLYSRIESGEKIFSYNIKSEASHRVLHEVEENLISSEAFGYLIQLRELGLLSAEDMEVIIEKIMVSAYAKISLKDIKQIVAEYFLDNDELTNSNKRIMLNSNDTIN